MYQSYPDVSYFATHRKHSEFKDVSLKTRATQIWHFFPTYQDNLENKSRTENLFPFLVLLFYIEKILPKVIRACLNSSAFFLSELISFLVPLLYYHSV